MQQIPNWSPDAANRQWIHKTDCGFNVEVIRRNEEVFGAYGPYRWNVYVHIFTSHPGFEEIVNNEGADLPLHAGQTYNRPIIDSTSKQLGWTFGADYMHFGDTKYTFMQHAPDVFEDADELIRFLSTYATNPDLA